MSGSSGHVPGAGTGSSRELHRARTRVRSIPSLLPATVNPRVPPPPEHTHLFPQASPGSLWDCSKPLQSRAQSTVQSLCSLSPTQTSPTHHGPSTDDISPTQGPQVHSGQTSRISALGPTPVCVSPGSCAELLPTCPALPSNKSSSETSPPPLGGGCFCRGHPPGCAPACPTRSSQCPKPGFRDPHPIRVASLNHPPDLKNCKSRKDVYLHL